MGALRARPPPPQHLPGAFRGKQLLAWAQADEEGDLLLHPALPPLSELLLYALWGSESPTSQNPFLGLPTPPGGRARARSLPQPLASGVTFVRHLNEGILFPQLQMDW